MAPYLPRNGVSGSPYSEGGALYALGLIHANHGQAIRWGGRPGGTLYTTIPAWLLTCDGVTGSQAVLVVRFPCPVLLLPRLRPDSS